MIRKIILIFVCDCSEMGIRDRQFSVREFTLFHSSSAYRSVFPQLFSVDTDGFNITANVLCANPPVSHMSDAIMMAKLSGKLNIIKCVFDVVVCRFDSQKSSNLHHHESHRPQYRRTNISGAISM